MGNFVAIATNDATVQEMAIETAGLSAEAEASGVKINLVPRDGGNSFKLTPNAACTTANTIIRWQIVDAPNF